MVKYLEIREDDDWLGESWSYFIPYEKLSDDLISELETFMKKFNNFSLVSTNLTRENVDFLMSRNGIDSQSEDRFRYHVLDDSLLTDEILEVFSSA